MQFMYTWNAINMIFHEVEFSRVFNAHKIALNAAVTFRSTTMTSVLPRGLIKIFECILVIFKGKWLTAIALLTMNREKQ